MATLTLSLIYDNDHFQMYSTQILTLIISQLVIGNLPLGLPSAAPRLHQDGVQPAEGPPEAAGTSVASVHEGMRQILSVMSQAIPSALFFIIGQSGET